MLKFKISQISLHNLNKIKFSSNILKSTNFFVYPLSFALPKIDNI